MRARSKCLGTVLLIQTVIFSATGRAQTPESSLTGIVTSPEEGPMEAVLVSAKREGSTITITVVSDSQGRYSFPKAKLQPGRYVLRIRAAGYELEAPQTTEVTAQKTAELNLKLRKTSDLASQLTNSEWLLSAPGSKADKEPLMHCQDCHSLERIFRSHYNADEVAKVAERMKHYFPGSSPERPQLLRPTQPARGNVGLPADAVTYVSKINLSSAPQWPYPLKTLPRLKGKSTRVIITEYDLPRPDTMPHDTIVDFDGTIWYCDFGQQYLGHLDPTTGEAVEYAVPALRPGFPTGCRDVVLDQEGTLWLTTWSHQAVAKFDRKTGQFQTWSLPKGMDKDSDPLLTGLMPKYVQVDGKIWAQLSGARMQRLDIRTGEWEREPLSVFKNIPPSSPAAAYKEHSIYNIFSDSKNNGYFSDFSNEFIGKVDAKTKEITFYSIPTRQSAPRRGTMDRQDRLWFGEFFGNRIGMFDTKTGKVQEWEIPTPFSGPYDAVMDKAGYVWTGGMSSDHIARLNTKTNELVEYQLPRSTNIRKVDVDNTSDRPALWVGNTHAASIIKVEPLE